MNLVKDKFLKGIVVILFSLNTQADFKQNQVRYFGYYDITSHLKKINAGGDCEEKTGENATVFGYNSPVTGKPASFNPNYDFVGKLLSCLKNQNIIGDLSELLSEKTIEQIESRFLMLEHVSEELKNSIINDLTLKFIGPEVVLVSYGLVKSQEEFNQYIGKSAEEFIRKTSGTTVSDYILAVTTLIHLRDEFLSY